MAENNRFERIAALLEERKANERRLAELTGHANAYAIHLPVLRAKLQMEKDNLAEIQRINKATKYSLEKVKKLAASSAEAEQALQKCKEVMTNFSVFEHPLLEKKKATLKELKEQWAGFMETVELPEKAKENEKLKTQLAELQQKLADKKQERSALMKSNNEMKNQEIDARNELVVQLVKMKIGNDAKKQEVDQAISKLNVTQEEHKNLKRDVEMKELQLAELKERHEKIASEQNGFFMAKLEYMQLPDYALDDSNNKATSPTRSLRSYMSDGRCDSPLRRPIELGLFNDGVRNRDDDSGPSRASASGVSAVQPRQSVLQLNPNRNDVTGAGVQLANRPPPSKMPFMSGPRQQQPSVVERNAGQLSPDPKRKRPLNENSAASVRPTERNDRDKRQEPVAGTSAEMFRTIEKPLSSKKPMTDRGDVRSIPKPEQKLQAPFSSASSGPGPSISSANDRRSGQNVIVTVQQERNDLGAPEIGTQNQSLPQQTSAISGEDSRDRNMSECTESSVDSSTTDHSASTESFESAVAARNNNKTPPRDEQSNPKPSTTAQIDMTSRERPQATNRHRIQVKTPSSLQRGGQVGQFPSNQRQLFPPPSFGDSTEDARKWNVGNGQKTTSGNADDIKLKSAGHSYGKRDGQPTPPQTSGHSKENTRTPGNGKTEKKASSSMEKSEKANKRRPSSHDSLFGDKLELFPGENSSKGGSKDLFDLDDGMDGAENPIPDTEGAGFGNLPEENPSMGGSMDFLDFSNMMDGAGNANPDSTDSFDFDALSPIGQFEFNSNDDAFNADFEMNDFDGNAAGNEADGMVVVGSNELADDVFAFDA